VVEGSAASSAVGERLRELRLGSWGASTTQKQVADALGLSVPLVSSWEAGKAIPPEDRLRSYALLFALASPPLDGLPDAADLTAEEEANRRQLIEDLIRLRDEALTPTKVAARSTGALGGRFWYFPDGARIRILTTPLWREAVGRTRLATVLSEFGVDLDYTVNGVSVRDILQANDRDPDGLVDRIPYANPRHPNYMESLHDADRDATIELIGHIRAENPTADVRFLTSDRATRDDLTGHVIVLGQADQIGRTSQGRPSVLEYVVRRQELPLTTRCLEGDDPEYDSVFVVTVDDEGSPKYYGAGTTPVKEETYKPVFLRDVAAGKRRRLIADGYPQLEYDVALLARQRNELNSNTTVTICAGIFSRGTYGAVRALTDANLRSSNERYLAENVDIREFWMLLHVPVFPGSGATETVTPDLTRAFHRLRLSKSR
jgi:transcriptional regulator with XRE-family HTH domain